MFILKTLKHHCAGRISPVGRFHIILRLSIFFLLLQLRLPCAPEQSLAWGLGFESALQVIDDADEDTVFSPNGDGVQDKLLISFAGDGSLGDFRIIIDVHGAGGIGPPDGKFSPDDDWLIKGAIGSGAAESDSPKVIRQEWDGKDRSPDQESPPTARTVRDGSYEIRVDIDAFQDGRVDEIFGYTSDTRSATIDTTSPGASVQVSQREFSPNGDGTEDSTKISYTLSEDLATLQLEFIETNIPAILFHGRSKGRYTYTWKGDDGFGIPLSDGIYNLHLRGSDRAGNIGMFTIGAVTIDTLPPSISQVTPGNNTFQNTPISVIEAIVNPDGGVSIDFTPTATKITLENENGDSIAGSHNSDESENRLTLTLNSPLDDLDENGVYTVTADAFDLAGNNAQRIVNFTFDTNPPIVTKVTASGAELKPGAAIKTPLMFVDAFLADNIALNRNASTIRLNGPKGEVDGVQSPIGENGIRWWLSFPLVADGTDDGTYTLIVTPLDNAANEGSQWQIPFVYDTQPPQLISLLPIEISEPQTFQNTPLSLITAAFDDANGSGVNLDTTTIEMVRHVEEDDWVPEAGALIPDLNNNTLTFRLNQPLQVRDGSQDGTYRVQVSFVDNVGNTQTTDAVLIYDTQAPVLVSTTPGDNETVSSLSKVSVRLNDVSSGVNFSSTTVRLLHEGNEIGVDTSDNGQDTVTLTLAKPLATDGSDDGEYTIEIAPADRAGNTGAVRAHRFFLDTRIPEIRLNSPSETQISTLTTIETQLLGYSGPGIYFSPVLQDGVLRRRSTIQVIGPDGMVVLPKDVSSDPENARLIWTIDTLLPRNGSADGEYTVSVRYEDFAGSAFTEEFTFTFDTQIPTIASTTPSAGDYVSQLSQALVKFESDLSGIDLGVSQVRLIQPDGSPILSNISDNGLDTIILQFNPLQTDGTADGIYAIEVTSADRAGNVADAPFQFEFTFATKAPEIRLNSPSETQISTLTTIETQLLGYSGPGIYFSPVLQDGVLRHKSTIQVIGPDGMVVLPKDVSSDAENARLIWTIDTLLPRNGSADGEYTVSVRYEDFAGSAFTEEFTFTFDTQIPTIASTTPSAGDYVSQLSQALVKFESDLSGIDLGVSQVRLIQPDGSPILSNISDNGLDTIILQFNPLQTDGTADGIYAIEVTSADRAGNVADAPFQFEFTFATKAPEIRLNSPSETQISTLTTIETQLLGYSGPGIYFSPVLQDGVLRHKSTIQVIGPDGMVVLPKDVSSDAENARLIWTIDTLLPRNGSADGEYTVSVRYEDFAGSAFTEEFTFTFDTQIPTIASTTPSAGDYVSQLSQALVKFESDLSGIDLGVSQVRLIQPDGSPILSNISDNGLDTIILQFNPLQTDGTADGIYAIEVTSADRAGNVADAPFQFEFTFATKAPEIDTLAPADNAIVNRVEEITAMLIDNSGSGIDFSKSTIILKGPSGERIMGTLRNDSVLTLTLETLLPTDGTVDGQYTIDFNLVDKLGTTANYTRHFLYDSQPPIITPDSRMPAESATTRNLIEVEFEVIDPAPQSNEDVGDGSGVDFVASEVQLLAPDNTPIDGEKTYDGISRITFESAVLPSVGAYTLVVTLMDFAGNRGVPQTFAITYDMEKPFIEALSVVSLSRVIPLDITGDASNVSDLLTQVTVVLGDDSAGIDFDRTSVQLLNLIGEAVPGALNNDSNATVWWLLDTPLSRNGDADGPYSIRVQAFDKAGNLEDRVFTLRYDTQAPNVHSIRAAQIDGASIDVLFQVPTVITSPIQQLTVVFSDKDGSGMDLSRTTVRLVDPNGDEIGGNQTDDGAGTVFFSFNPLRADGSADGRYRILVTLADLAGNMFTSPIEFPFFYSTQKPEIVSTTPAEFSTATQLTSVSATLLDHSGGGIDFDHSTIQLQGPNDNTLPGRMRVDKSTSTLTLELGSPLPRNGDADGEYIIGLTVVDKAGNLVEVSRTFIYDTQIPQIVSVTANTATPAPIPAEQLQIIDTSLSEITVRFSDANDEIGQVSGVDLVGTEVRLIALGDIQVDVHTTDDGVDMMTISFTRLNRSGTYTLEITPRDRAGNVSGHVVPYKFRIELAPPRVDIITVSGHTVPVEFVNALDAITASLVDVSGVGLDLTSDGSNITVVGPNGEVDGIQSTSGTNEIVWTPLQLASDGTMDGTYTATITPVDSAGAAGVPARHQFIFDSQPPVMSAIAPIDLTQAVSYIGEQISQIAALVVDVGPAGLKIDEQRLHLWDAHGNLISGDLTDDGTELIIFTLSQPLATDGSDDGTYSVVVVLSDNAGNLSGIAHQLVYDTIAPRVQTHPADGEAISDDVRLITADLQDTGDSGIDFGASTLTLLDANGVEIGGEPNNDGRARMMLRIPGLVEDGNYTIRVQAVDRAGNGADTPFMASFLFSSSIPAVVTTVPATSPSEKAFTNRPLRQVEAQLQLDGGVSGRSTIALLAPDDTRVAGIQTEAGSRLVYRLSRPLAADGSDDGMYTISVIPVNRAGRQGSPRQFTFAYDTVPPEVDPDTVSLIVAEPGVNNALNEIQVPVTDDEPSSGIDWDNLAESWLTLEKIETGQQIRGTLYSDGQQTLSFRLTTPLASDGSQDGQYRVTLLAEDRADNVSEPVIYEFFYDTRPPIIITDSLEINDLPLLYDRNRPDYPSATNSSSGVVIRSRLEDITLDGGRGLGVDLSQSMITLRGPDDNPINGSLRQNGVDEIEFKSDALTVEGIYQVAITSVGLDEENLGFQPSDSISMQFLHERTEPVAALTDFGGVTTLENEPIPLKGTAHDPETDEVSASGVLLVEIVGVGPNGIPINSVIAQDESEAEEEPWSRWSLDFLPSQSGVYNLDVRATDRAGNATVVDGVTATFAVSLSFKGSTYAWPNPVRQAAGDTANFSFDVNATDDEVLDVLLSIYDFAGDLVFYEEFQDIRAGRTDQLVTWNLENQSGADVARGVYVFRLEAQRAGAKERTNAIGKILVVE